MNSPIRNRINTIFVHVRDLKESVRWYAELIDQPYDLKTVKDPVYNLPINHFTGLTLDSGPEGVRKDPSRSDYPLFNFHTEDIEKAFTFVKGKDYEVCSDITRYEDFAFFTIKDLDSNIIMICTG
ncbi:VOC family protein [Bacillus sp. P14.5]|uniref:VOC family protein n=1 Tax=Bacillus sp. P14.5 TaxID=1983400 RepID=UPI000DEB6A5F|nr:VOC family protein [Bacillus sp. P14.5]